LSIIFINNRSNLLWRQIKAKFIVANFTLALFMLNDKKLGEHIKNSNNNKKNKSNNDYNKIKAPYYFQLVEPLFISTFVSLYQIKQVQE